MTFDNIATDVVDNINIPTFHNKVDRKAENTYTKLIKEPFYKEINRNAVPNGVTWMSVDALIPLETQRDTKSTWAAEKFKTREGFDWLCFPPLSVAHKLPDPNFYVYDGCGRFFMAQLMGIKEVPCWIIEADKKTAAGLFAYTQSDGRRNLSKEIIFANQVEAEEPTALKHRDWLDEFNLFVEAATDVTVGDVNGDLVKYRFVTQAYDYPKDYIKQVLSWMRSAWPEAEYIQQDIALGLLHFVEKTPAAMKNGLNKAITNFFKDKVATSYRTPSMCKWKHDGGNQDNQYAASVALGFYEEFHKSSYWNDSFRQCIKKRNFAPK